VRLTRAVVAGPVAIPKTRALLRWVYLGRLSVAAALYVAAVMKFRVATNVDLLVVSLVVVTTLIVTLVSFWHTHVRDRPPGRAFLHLQALFDTALITVVVHVTGGPQSDFAGLYVVLVAVTAVLMPVAGTAIITVIVAAAYLGAWSSVFRGRASRARRSRWWCSDWSPWSRHTSRPASR
jgi:hypothetical protein